MPISRSSKISLLLAVDVVFFVVEITVGYVVGSLALVADSFHMLNDVMSLIVALYAIKLSKSKASPTYSYGWYRAEIVAALINGVFLLALCFSIVMEAIQRFFSKPEVTNPKLVVVVGSLGLLSNIFGLLLFHEHAHSHNHHPPKVTVKVSNGTAATAAATAVSPAEPQPVPTTTAPNGSDIENNIPTEAEDDSFDQLYGFPAATRASVVQTAQDIAYGRPVSPMSHKVPIGITHEGSRSRSSFSEARRSVDTRQGRGVSLEVPRPEIHVMPVTSATELETVESAQPTTALTVVAESADLSAASTTTVTDEFSQLPPAAPARHTGDHGSMNMRALILHVIGDALGNVGVIATGLIIWLSTWEHRFYFDPIISLIITVIIFSSALPLVRSAAFILLQAVPATISIQDLHRDVENVEGVLSIHELHVWQLSETRFVASIHVQVSHKREYMHIAQDIQTVFHEHGVHSSTIQPEFNISTNGPSDEQTLNRETHCMISCPPGQDCATNNGCCPRPTPLVEV